LGLIATGFWLCVIGLIGFLISLDSASAYSFSENIGVHTVVVAELKLRDVQRMAFSMTTWLN
jgi:hypothetical protein